MSLLNNEDLKNKYLRGTSPFSKLKYYNMVFFFLKAFYFQKNA
jgi:hypothetical protein